MIKLPTAAALAGAVTLAAAAGTALAQRSLTDRLDARTAQSHSHAVWMQLQRLFAISATEGYDSRNFIVGKLAQDGLDSWGMTLEAGQDFIVTAVCDRDCEDIDLALLRADGSTIKQDNLSNDFPAVSYAPAADQAVQIEVRMQSCAFSPCYFGIGVFEKPLL